MGKKVVISFSGGKDSVLSLHKAVSLGYEPIALMTTINKNKGDSWFHDISSDLLKQVSLAINIPLLLVECSGENYENTFEIALKNMKNLGAEACIFGDIDIAHHREWGEIRCKNTGLEAIFPLWQENRETLVKEFIDLGYKAIIKKVNLKNMNVDLLFKIAAVGILVAVLHQVLCRAGREEQAMMTTLAGLVIVLTLVIKEISSLFDTVRTLFNL